MSVSFVRPSDLVGAHIQEAIKAHFVYDVYNRMTESYTALASAADGDKALKTSYAYDGTSTRVVNTKEEISAWDSSWDF